SAGGRSASVGGGSTLSGMETAAVAFYEAYQAAWSSDDEVALGFLGKVYGGSVLYHGRQLTTAAILEQKRTFAAQWPKRRFVPRPGNGMHRCSTARVEWSVFGVVDWAIENDSGAQQGSAVVELIFNISGDVVTVTAESARTAHAETAAR
ncbi:hypothetical protein WDZ92_34990, partial [Nostoc sp. NIES-2111]